MSFMTQHHVTSAVAYACLRKVGKIICYWSDVTHL
jgi:hypothetical protein